jgi:hypothetical protein
LAAAPHAGTSAPAVALAAVLAVAALLLGGCGGSLADADAPRPSRAQRPPPGDFCTAVKAGAAATRPLAALVAQGGVVPRERLAAAAAKVRAANADVLATAPGEIRPDVERSVALVEMQIAALEAADGDTGAVAGDAAMRSTVAAPEYTGASRRVREYVDTHCGVDVGRLGS